MHNPPAVVVAPQKNHISGGCATAATPLAIYVHWPWCKAKCPYCDFNSHVTEVIPEDDYVAALIQDVKQYSHLVSQYTLTSIFFGGGTPSLMRPQTVEKILQSIHQIISIQSSTEITLEANPTSSEGGRLRDFIQAGVNRLSIGVQGLDQAELTFLGRHHSAVEAVQVVEDAIKYCNNVSLDLIYGLPDQSLETWSKQLTWATTIGTQHLSAYQLTIEENTRFYALWRRGELNPMPDEKQRDFYDLTNDIMGLSGYEHYEISNYARPGYMSQHNTHVWRYLPYLGIGAGAHGRYYSGNNNLNASAQRKLPAHYIADQSCGKPLGSVSTPLTTPEMAVENLLMSIRLREGIDLVAAQNRLGQPITDFMDHTELARLAALGMVKRSATHLWVPQAYWPVLDGIIKALAL